jgi:methyltransferase (TIGR00027 family)
MALDETESSRLDPASTAEGAATFRAAGAAEPDPKVRNPDVLAADFIAWGVRAAALAKTPGLRRLVPRIGERMVPGAYYYETARTLHIDRVLREEIRGGITQLVLLGAGYDSRPYRMADALSGVRVFEVDHPALSAIKRQKVRAILGELPANVTYVEIDFTRQDLAEQLAAHGHDLGEPTLYVWSGVAPYLPEQAVTEVLSFVAAHESPATSILFDYCFREAVEGDDSLYGAPELRARVQRMGEPLRSGIPHGTAREYVEAIGLRLEEDLGPEDLKERYLIRSDGDVYGHPYGFMGFSHARVAS